ncbi:MAG: beta-lactamase family protein [Acidobacteria bacterium]|nr:beta-lactamase family protein [Acidobacteriota bacterium]
MRRKTCKLPTAALILWACAALAAESASRAAEVDALLTQFDRQDAPGVSVLVVLRGKAVYRKAFGMADLEKRVAATPRTNYRLASLTKQFTAMAVMLLADRGKLRYDQTLGGILAGMPKWADRVTIRQLLQHTSGVRPYEAGLPDIPPEQVTPDKQITDRGVLERLKREDTTLFEPGSAYRYSNSGYALLGLIVEQASGLSFTEFLRRNIFLPLGMKATVAHVEGRSVVSRRAYGYSKRGATFARTDQSVTSAVLADGGVYSSLEDLGRWIRALERGALVSAASWREAVTPGLLNRGRATAYGFGWEVGTYRGRTAWSHSGTTIGFRNHIARYPEDRLAVVILANRADVDAVKLGRQIADLYLP